MKNLFFGIIIGALLCGLIGYLALGSFKQAAHDEGYNDGVKSGIATGAAEGIAKGKAQVLADQKREQDSTAMAAQKKVEQTKAAQKYHKPAPVQNWHVVEGKIDEPVK